MNAFLVVMWIAILAVAAVSTAAFAKSAANLNAADHQR
jgi:hypothetical protein